MKEFLKILAYNNKHYHWMEPCDAVKLVYQSVYGPGHLIESDLSARLKLAQEYTSIPHTGTFRAESLGSTARVYIDAPLSERQLQLLARIFSASSRNFVPNWGMDFAADSLFNRRLQLVRRLAAQDFFHFDRETLDAYLREYYECKCPAVSHSSLYRDTYAPAYRVIDSRYLRLFPALLKIGRLLEASERVVVAIDGRCASGKSTAAELISSIYPAEIIHMDDFFLPGELRTRRRLHEVGGNLHRERFLEEVIPHLRGGSFQYRVFDCSTFDYAPAPHYVYPGKLILCEGSYALHPEFGKYYDLAVFVDVDPDEQLRRIRERSGEALLKRFKKEWIPMEERYFDGMSVRERCDFIIK